MAHFKSQSTSWSSKKLLFGAGTSLVMFLSWVLLSKFPVLEPSFTTLIGGLTGVLTVVTTGNLVGTLITGNQAVKVHKDSEKADEAPVEESPTP